MRGLGLLSLWGKGLVFRVEFMALGPMGLGCLTTGLEERGNHQNQSYPVVATVAFKGMAAGVGGATKHTSHYH